MNVEALLGDVGESTEAEDPGVVDQNVEPSEGVVDFFEHPRNLRGLGHVSPDRPRLTASVDDRLSHALRAFPVGGVIHCHARTRGRKRLGNSAADALGSACHNRYFVSKTAHIHHSAPIETKSVVPDRTTTNGEKEDAR